jgi:hypothetical protein
MALAHGCSFPCVTTDFSANKTGRVTADPALSAIPSISAVTAIRQEVRHQCGKEEDRQQRPGNAIDLSEGESERRCTIRRPDI